MKTIVTIHDLAFKFFPKYFTAKDLFKLNLLADHAIKKADKIIAISASTKKDILKLYPSIKEEKITVIHHGFDAELFQKEIKQNETEKILAQHNLKKDFYLLYVGAIQPRKNLNTLIEAFEKIKESYPEMKLVLAGEKAWMWEGVLQKIKKSPAKNDIVITGKLSFSELPVLYRNAAVFVFPSLYEGFGMPVLEAFASKVPVICANNSSLPEVGGEAALYFEKSDSQELSLKIKSLLENMNFRQEMIAKGEKRLKEFSWEKCVQETLNEIKS